MPNIYKCITAVTRASPLATKADVYQIMTEQLELPVSSLASPSLLSDVVVTPAWYGLKQQIRHLAQFGGSVQVVHGAKGSGKTTLLRLLCNPAENLPIVALDAGEGHNLQVLLTRLLDDLGVGGEGSSTGELIAQLRSYVQQLERGHARVVVAIDNADLIDDASLAALISVLQGSASSGFGLHWLFLADKGLAERLDQLQLLDVSVSDVAMPNFSPSELKTLMKEAHKHKRLRTAIPVEHIQKIWLQSGGLPGVALEIAEHSVRHKQEAKQMLSGTWPYSHVAAILVLVLVLMWAVLVRDDTSSGKSEVNSTIGQPSVPVTAEMSKPKDVTADIKALYATDDGLNPTSEHESPVLQETSELQVAVTNEPRTKHSESNAETVANVGANLDSVSVSKPQDDKVESMAGTQPLTASNTNTLSDKPKEIQAKAEAAVSTSEEQSRRGASSAERVYSDEERLLALPGNSYVLQLMATSALESLYNYVNAQPNRANLMVYQGIRSGKRLYILVEGFYNDSSAAQMAVINLPAIQRNADPWPKKVSQIHEEIRQSRVK